MNIFNILKDKLEDICKTGCKKDFDLGLCRNYENCIDCITSKIRDEVDKIEQEYNNGWIPCSDRLPEKNGVYLVTQKRYSIETKREIGIETDYVKFEYGKWSRARFLEVIAWMPLPEPYKEV